MKLIGLLCLAGMLMFIAVGCKKKPTKPAEPAKPNEPTKLTPPIMYVDDDAPFDPGSGDPGRSDPNEDGSAAHPFDAIQEAINAAPNGYTIIVRDGTYTGSGNRDINFKGKVITVRSQNGPESCIIDCQGTASENHRGFHFRSSEGANSVLCGFTITNGYVSGGGVYGIGAGVYCRNSSPTITNCIIKDNYAVLAGGGIRCISASPTINNCVISNNYKGGISCSGGSPMIVNCTLSGNTATAGGAGLYCSYSASPTITNSIFWGDSRGEIKVESGSPVVTYSDIQGGWLGEGNIDADPQLTGDGYHLQAKSPCVNAGNPAGNYSDYKDIDGEPRLIHGRVDMGADEYSTP
jgi:parallel beta-helix repeat protein